MSRRGRWEYLKAIHPRYQPASRLEKQWILDEFCTVTRYHRKSALRLLNGAPPARQPRAARRRPPRYGTRVIQVLAAIWRAAGYPWSLRLKALLPLWLPWARQRFRLTPPLEAQLLRLSPRQMDRRLASYRRPGRTGRYGGTKPGTLLKHHIPLRTDRCVMRDVVDSLELPSRHRHDRLRDPRGPGGKRARRGILTETRTEGRALLRIGHELAVFRSPEDVVECRAGRRFRTKCGKASGQARRGMLVLERRSESRGTLSELFHSVNDVPHYVVKADATSTG